MGTIRLRTLGDYCRKGYSLRVECQCNRIVLLDPHELLAIIAAKGWTSYTLEGIAMRLRCERCGRRPKEVGPGLAI